MNFTKLRFKTISYVISSPRDSQAFYRGIDFDDKKLNDIDNNNNIIDKTKINIIYPFHQYGQYKILDDKNNNYYIPGSSIKGSLLINDYKVNDINIKIMIDDATIDRNNVTLKQLKKIQYLPKLSNEKSDNESEQKNEEQKQTKHNVFFENVAVQMLKPNTVFSCDMYTSEKIDIQNLIKEANETCRKNLELVTKQIELYRNVIIGDDVKEKLNKENENIENLLNNKDKSIIIIGGYKGLLMSLKDNYNNITNKDLKINESALFFDDVCIYPYGLVELEI